MKKLLIFIPVLVLAGLGVNYLLAPADCQARAWYGSCLDREEIQEDVQEETAEEVKGGADEGADEFSDDSLALEKYLPLPGYYAPPFKLFDSDGVEFDLKEMKGRNLLLIFETTTCGWCRRELPSIKKIRGEYEAFLDVVTVSMGESKETVSAWREEADIERRWLLDTDQSVSNIYWVSGTPSHFLINEEGKIVETRPGYATYEQLKELVENLLADSDE